jgi:recombination protein RecA
MAKKDTKKTATLGDLRSKYGRPPTEFIDTKIPPINELFGGGLPTGKYIEIHSEAGLGKSTIFLQIARACLEQGKSVAFMDVECALDVPLKDSMNVSQYEEKIWKDDLPWFLHVSPNKYSEVEETVEFLFSVGYNIIVFDSLTQTVPDKRSDGSITDVQPGQKAMLQSIFLEQYKAILARTGTTMLIVNQMRTKISFIRTTVEPAGGKSLQYNMDIRCGMRRLSWVKGKDEDGNECNVGIELELTTIKNKMTAPFQQLVGILKFGKGIDVIETLIINLLKKGKIKQSGAYFKCELADKNLQGRDNMYEHVKENFDAYNRLLGNYTEFMEGSDPNEAPKPKEEMIPGALEKDPAL